MSIVNTTPFGPHLKRCNTDYKYYKSGVVEDLSDPFYVFKNDKRYYLAGTHLSFCVSGIGKSDYSLSAWKLPGGLLKISGWMERDSTEETYTSYNPDPTLSDYDLPVSVNSGYILLPFDVQNGFGVSRGCYIHPTNKKLMRGYFDVSVMRDTKKSVSYLRIDEHLPGYLKDMRCVFWMFLPSLICTVAPGSLKKTMDQS